jgi:hypothetical protein
LVDEGYFTVPVGPECWKEREERDNQTSRSGLQLKMKNTNFEENTAQNGRSSKTDDSCQYP